MNNKTTVFENTRGDLALSERLSLLEQFLLTAHQPPIVEGEPRFSGVNGSNIHAYNSLVAYVGRVIQVINKKLKDKEPFSRIDLVNLNRVEHYTMAWNRGGVEEYRQLRRNHWIYLKDRDCEEQLERYNNCT